MVARDAQTHKAKKIAQLAIETDDEKELWAIGEGHKRRKREGSLVALDKVPVRNSHLSNGIDRCSPRRKRQKRFIP